MATEAGQAPKAFASRHHQAGHRLGRVGDQGWPLMDRTCAAASCELCGKDSGTEDFRCGQGCSWSMCKECIEVMESPCHFQVLNALRCFRELCFKCVRKVSPTHLSDPGHPLLVVSPDSCARIRPSERGVAGATPFLKCVVKASSLSHAPRGAPTTRYA